MVELTRRVMLGSTAAAVATATTFDSFNGISAFAGTPNLKVGTNSLIEGTFRSNPGSPGNFEALLLDGHNLMHYWRDNSTAGFSWHPSVAVSTASTGPACLIQSSFKGTPGSLGNFEALVLEGHNLWHYWRDNSAPGLPWHRSVLVSAAATGQATMIESSFRSNPGSPGNFEALVPEGNKLWHYWRDNSTAGFPWHKTVVVSAASTGPACLIQSNFKGTPTSLGNFEALVLEGKNLWHYWRDNTTAGFPWHKTVVVSGTSTGPACLIQGSFKGGPSSLGNFEALVLEGNNLWHYWRDNSAPGFPWHKSVVVDPAARGPATFIEGSFRAIASQPGNFEALVQESPSVSVMHYWRDNSTTGFPWHPSVAP
jgi:hypothetical protein